MAADSIARRLERLMIARGMNPKSLSRAAGGGGETYVRDVLSGKSKNPRTAHMQKIAEALECPLSDLLPDEAPAMRGIRSNNLDQTDPDALGLPTTPVLEVETYIGMGGGGLMEDGRVIARWQLPTEWLRSEIRSSDVAQLVIVTLEGDSMEGTLAPGDKVIVDLGRKTPSPPGIFVIFDGLGQVAKRLYYQEGTQPPLVSVMSDNPRYGPYERALSEMNIIGRVMGRWQRLS